MSEAVADEMTAAVEVYLSRCVRTEAGCLINPRLREGAYGEVRWGNRRMAAHRAVLSLRCGEVPASDVVSRHACDNPRCVEVEHLSFGPQSLNLHDQYARKRRTTGWAKGERRPQALITEHDVCEMRRMSRAGTPMQQIADQFNAGYSATRSAVRGETWAHVQVEPPLPGRTNRVGNSRAYRLTRQGDAQQVAAMCASGYSLQMVARELGISRSTAWRLLDASRGAA